MWTEFKSKFGLDEPLADSLFLVGYGSTFLTVELKQSRPLTDDNDDLTKAVAGTTSTESRDRARPVVKQLLEMRSASLKPERTELGVFTILKYCWQLENLEQRLAETGTQPSIKFSWFECFQTSKQQVCRTILEEKACMLFNAGARYSQLGALQDVWSRDGLRAAAMYFQQAAGVFLHIRDRLVVRFDNNPQRNSDLSEATLTALYNLMLAQAHECFFERTNIENANSNLSAQLAMQTADYYDVAYRNSNEKVRMMDQPRFPKTWPAHMLTKSLLFSAIAQFHVPPSLQNKELGERVFRLQKATGFLSKATEAAKQASSTLRQLVQKHAQSIEAQLKLAVKTNDEIHRELIPSEGELSALKHTVTPLVAAIQIASAADWDAKGFANTTLNIFAEIPLPAEYDRWQTHCTSMSAALTAIRKQLDQLAVQLKSCERWSTSLADVNIASGLALYRQHETDQPLQSILETLSGELAANILTQFEQNREAFLLLQHATKQTVIHFSALPDDLNDAVLLATEEMNKILRTVQQHEQTISSTIPSRASLVDLMGDQAESIRQLQIDISALKERVQPVLTWFHNEVDERQRAIKSALCVYQEIRDQARRALTAAQKKAGKEFAENEIIAVVAKKDVSSPTGFNGSPKLSKPRNAAAPSAQQQAAHEALPSTKISSHHKSKLASAPTNLSAQQLKPQPSRAAPEHDHQNMKPGARQVTTRIPTETVALKPKSSAFVDAFSSLQQENEQLFRQFASS